MGLLRPTNSSTLFSALVLHQSRVAGSPAEVFKSCEISGVFWFLPRIEKKEELEWFFGGLFSAEGTRDKAAEPG